MIKRFIGKTAREKMVRFNTLTTETLMETDNIKQPEHKVVVEDNNDIKEVKDMMDINKVEDMLNINGQEVKTPKRKVKYEKKERGLIEHTENSQIVINEDNKMLLND